MYRLGVALLVGGALGVVGNSTVMAQTHVPASETDAGPVVFEGRLEVQPAGFAFTAPGGWYAFDLSDPDVVAETETMLGEEWASWVQDWRPGYAALASAEQGWSMCVVSFDADRPTTLESVRDNTIALGGDFETIDLPGGTAIHDVMLDGDEPEEVFEWFRPDGLYYLLWCLGDVDDDDWLSIAETFEFLPAAGTGDGARSSELVGPGGRVEVPDAGFALTVPDDWVWARYHGQDIEETTRLLQAERGGNDVEILRAIATALAVQNPVIALGPEGASCGVEIQPPQVTVEYLLLLYRARAHEVDLPGGPAVRVDLAYEQDGESVEHSVYHLTNGADGRVYSLRCRSQHPPQDRWLSIAETFEFLPEG